MTIYIILASGFVQVVRVNVFSSRHSVFRVMYCYCTDKEYSLVSTNENKEKRSFVETRHHNDVIWKLALLAGIAMGAIIFVLAPEVKPIDTRAFGAIVAAGAIGLAWFTRNRR